MSYTFQSGLAAEIQAMMDYKVSLGYSRASYLTHSIAFDRYCAEFFPESAELTREITDGWLQKREEESLAVFHGRVGYLRGFGKYLSAMGKNAYIVPKKFTSCRTNFVPYIFTDRELTDLFHVIDSFHGSNNELEPFLYSTVFRLIYTCGLRPNEGRKLRCDSVNLKTGEILITETKRHKDRIVVMSDDMRRLAASYAAMRDAAYPDSPYFFPDKNGNLYSASSLQKKFKQFFADANPDTDPEFLPAVRIYDLSYPNHYKIQTFYANAVHTVRFLG